MKRAMPFLKKNPAFTVFAILALGVIAAAVFAPVLATHNPYEAVLADAVQPPSSEHWFGTDRMGRDLFSRVLYGARTSLTASLSLVCIIVTAGTALGIAAGYFGGILDAVIMRISDMMISFPGMVLAIAVAGIVYVVSLFLLHVVSREDILLLPKGEKIARLLEKRGWIR